MPPRTELPDTLKRSSKHAQDTWRETHDSAARSYGDGERAYRTAYAALKHSFEKVGDRWVKKERRGPSDPQAAKGGRPTRSSRAQTAGGVDVFGHTRDELYERAAGLDVRGRSRMTKMELARAIARKQD